MGSLQLAMETGLPSKIENHASYVQNWLMVLKSGDKKALFMAAAKSSQAVDFVMGRQAPEVAAEKAVAAAPASSEKPVTVIGTPVRVPVTDTTAIPTAIAVVAKLKERRAKQTGPAAPSKGPAANL